MNIFINALYVDSSHNEIYEKRFPLIYFWLKDYYFQKSGNNFPKTSWSFSDDEIPISENILLQEQFKQSPPDIVGLSLYIWNENLFFENARWLKEHYPNALIVAAGPSADSNILFFQTHPYIDIVMLGPAAETFRRLIDAKLDNSDCRNVDGISYVNNGKLISNKPIPRHQDPLILNYVNNFRNEVVELIDKLFLTCHRVVFPTLLIQGCPYSCSFCEQGTALWTKLNWRPIEHIYSEIDLLKNYDSIVFDFIDANFGIDANYEKILDYIIKNNANGQFLLNRPTMAKNKVDVTFHLLDKMIENNLLANPAEHGYIALQDTNADVLKLNGRPMSKEFEKIEKFKEFTKDHPHKTSQVDIIIGMPGQSFKSLSTTLYDLLKNDLLSHANPHLYSIFPNTTLTADDNKIYFKHNTVYLRSKTGYFNRNLVEPATQNENSILKHIIETEAINSKELIAAYYMFVMLGHAYGFLGWLRTPLNYLKNYYGINEKQFVAAYTESFAPENWNSLPEPICEDLNSLHRWFIGEDKFLQRKDITNRDFLTPNKISKYRFHADYDIVSDFFKEIFKGLINCNDNQLDNLMSWQAAKTLNFRNHSDCKIVSYNYDDIASMKDEIFYKSCFEFKFNYTDYDTLYQGMLGIVDINFIPNIEVSAVSSNEQVALHKNDIKNNHFNSI